MSESSARPSAGSPEDLHEVIVRGIERALETHRERDQTSPTWRIVAGGFTLPAADPAEEGGDQ
jgi:hypothetical protein